MCKKLFCLMTLILLLGLCNTSLGVALQVDIGLCYDAIPQPDWIGLNGCRTHNDVGGTLIDFSVEVGFGPGSNACDCRKESGATHELQWVHQTFIMQGGPDPQPPNSDIVFTLMDLSPGAQYTLLTYHGNWDASDNVINSITVTGATNVTKPSSIAQNHAFAPGEFTFTAGSGDVVIRYSCLSGGQPYFNGFELYGGGASIQFESASSGELETVTSAQIPVLINDANVSATYTVNYDVIGGTADAGGEDYTLAPGTLTFLPGSSTEYIIVDINDDDLDENDETIVIELSNPAGPNVGLGSPAQHAYTIIDPRPTVEFERASGRGMEYFTPAYVPVRLSAPATETITVDYAVIGGTASGGGVDYILDPGTVLFNPNDVTKTISIEIISDSNDQEPIETVIIELSDPTNALLGGQTVYTHKIVSQTIDLMVDFALVQWGSTEPRPETAKPGWTIWAAGSWADMYSHDCVTFEDVGGTGIEARMSLIREGDGGLKVSGLTMPALNGGGPPSGSPIHDPICNSWYQAVDWPEFEWGSIVLALHDLPAGEYRLYSYHNHFGCYRGSPVSCDCVCNPAPPMPSISAMSVKEIREAYADSTENKFPDAFQKLTGANWQTGPFLEGVTAIESAYNVQPQQVTSDDELVPSLISFETNGSPVLVVYEAGCCEVDPVRTGRVGGRGILNAFILEIAVKTPYAWFPIPLDGAGNVPPNVGLTWKPGVGATSHDVFFGTDFDDVNDANSTNHPNVDYNSVDANSYDPGGLTLGEVYYWRIDEANDPCLWTGHVWKFTVTDGKASNPNPADRAPDVPSDVVISWAPGDYATSHDVYLGTDWGDVNDANSTTHPNVDYNNVDANSYDPGGLALGETYYWRTDELIGSTSRKGVVWRFTTANYVSVEDFESYDAENPLVYQLGIAENGTWIDGLTFTNGTSAFLQLVTAPNSLPTLGMGTMAFNYDCYNPWYINSFYAEGKRPITENDEDWTAGGSKALSLWFHGTAGNDAEQMYVALGDGSNEAVVEYDRDANDLKKEEWQEWNVDLRHFKQPTQTPPNDVNLASIDSFYIGFGDRENPQQSGSGILSAVYFDNIRLYIRRCVAEYGPEADLSGDCIVDLEDLQVMVMEEEWLTSGIKADLVDDDNVNFKDYAILMDAWLEGPLLWPE